VEAILEGAARVLVARGYAGASTNHIAAAAGVSVGSLYEYFPNKQAVFTALLLSHLAQGRGRLVATLDDLDARAAASPGPLPLATLVSELVAAVMAIHAEAPAVHHRLFAEVPRAPEVRTGLAALEEEVFHRVLRLLDGHPEVGARNLPAAVVVALQAVDALAHRWVAEQQAAGAAELAAAELVRMVSGYLRGGAPRG
jgi:AcrR family transcriptional regulator